MQEIVQFAWLCIEIVVDLYDINYANKKSILFLKKLLTKAELFSIISLVHRGIAQLVEYWSPKPWVVGSSPSAPAKKIDKFRLVDFFIQAAGLVCNHASACMVSP